MLEGGGLRLEAVGRKVEAEVCWETLED